MKKNFVKFSSLLLVLLILLSTFMSINFTATAAETQKVERSYDIAVVFDNSGSMYQNSMAWCRAKYAMEIFASMLNYENGDRLRIYPMWSVTTDGSQPISGGSTDAIEVLSEADFDKISNLYTVDDNGTPFAPVWEAQADMKTSNATDKWLIVMTDGKFNQKQRNETVPDISGKDLRDMLINVASDDLKVQYLGFGKATNLESAENKNFYAKKSTDESLKDDLINICNAIFQRSVMPKDRLNGKKLEIDLSMKNLIVFVQGDNAKIKSLTDENGKEIPIILNSGQRKYSTVKAKRYKDIAKVDKTLAGQVVTFGECPTGKYTLNYTGSADAVQIFYEPDVDIQVTVTDAKTKKKVDASSGAINAGEYILESKIVDSKTGKDVTKHELMRKDGSDVVLKTFVKTSEEPDGVEYENGAKINLKPNENTEITVVGTYLKDYTITSKGNPDLDWMNNLVVKPPKAEFEVKAEVLQDGSWYKLSDNAEWEPVKLTLTLDGKALTEEELERTNLSINASDDLPLRVERIEGESAYNVYIAQDENGKYTEPDTGIYSVKVGATYTDKYGEKTESDDRVSFEIQKYSKIWRWLIYVVGLIALALLIWFILTRKAWPLKMEFVQDLGKGRTQSHSIKIGKKGELEIVPVYSALNVKVVKNTPLYKALSNRANIKVVEVEKPRKSISSYSINHMKFSSSTNFKFSGQPFSGIISNNTPISVTFNDVHGTISGTIKINK